MTWLDELKSLFFGPDENLRQLNNELDQLKKEIDRLKTDKFATLDERIEYLYKLSKLSQKLEAKNKSLTGKLGWMTRNRNDWKAKAYEWSNQDNAI